MRNHKTDYSNSETRKNQTNQLGCQMTVIIVFAFQILWMKAFNSKTSQGNPAITNFKMRGK